MLTYNHKCEATPKLLMCRLNFNYSLLVSDGELVNASNDAFVGTQYDAKTKIVSNGKTLYLQDENPGLNFERTWLATSSSGGFGGFTKRVVSFCYDISFYGSGQEPCPVTGLPG